MNDQVQQARGAAPAADRGAASGDGAGAAAFPGWPALNGLPGAGPAANAWSEYWVDRLQRSVLYWDVMRKRGNQSIEHWQWGKPPVLVLDYETVIDGRSLDRPINYALLRILPRPGTAIDPAARPFVVVEPRAGHGPGIGGFKEASQVGVAMRAGHPVYFVSFFPGATASDDGKAAEDAVAAVAEDGTEARGRCPPGRATARLAAAGGGGE